MNDGWMGFSIDGWMNKKAQKSDVNDWRNGKISENQDLTKQGGTHLNSCGHCGRMRKGRHVC